MEIANINPLTAFATNELNDLTIFSFLINGMVINIGEEKRIHFRAWLWSLILISMAKGHTADSGTLLIYGINLFSFISIFVLIHVTRLTCCLNCCWRQCPFCTPFRSIPTPENVPRGSWLLDDHVLQHYPIPLHLLTHLQPFPADGWEYEVSRSISLAMFPHSLLSLCLSYYCTLFGWCDWSKRLTRTETQSQSE